MTQDSKNFLNFTDKAVFTIGQPKDGEIRIVVNLETVMDDDFNEFAPLIEPLTGKPFLVDGNQAKPDLLDLEDISPGRKLRSW